MAFPSGWERKCLRPIKATAIDAALTSFPAIFTEASLPSEMLNVSSGNSCLDGGGDIRASSDELGTTQLPVDVRECHPTADGIDSYANIVVGVPAVSATVDTDIYIWYKKTAEVQPAADSTFGSQAVYDANYAAVYPLHEAGAGVTGEYKDRTSNANHGTGGNGSAVLTPTVGSEGVLVQAKNSFSGTQWIQVPTSVSLNIIADMSVSAVHLTATNGGLTSLAKVDNTLQQFELYYFNKVPNFYTYGTDNRLSSATLIGTSVSTHVAASYDSAASTGWLRINGADVTTDGTAGNITTAACDLFLGAAGNGSGTIRNGWVGALEEIRISNAKRSAEWYDAEYDNYFTPSAFFDLTADPVNGYTPPGIPCGGYQILGNLNL